MRDQKGQKGQKGQKEQGLRSVQSIRWLLIMGSLVTAVSVYRLMESHWTLLSAPGQFLSLAGGTFVLYLAGRVVRRRLLLPHAGTALLFLFTALVPVLSWGAAYLELLASPAGWVVFATSMTILLVATAHVWKETLGYEGHLFGGSFGGLTFALPLLPYAEALLPLREESARAVLAILLGVVLYTGSRSINRFLFHRDRRDGVDRPLNLVPFAVLALLYVAGMFLLEPASTVVAFPLMFVGVVFVETGEEYYRALAQSLGRAPERWPSRSVALLSIGVALSVAAVILASQMVHWQHSAWVLAAAAWLGLRWALRYGSAIAHFAGLVSAFSAYYLMVEGIGLAGLLGSFAPGVATASPALTGWTHLGLLAGFWGWMALLRSRRAPADLERVHDLAILVLSIAMVCQTWLDVRAAVVILPPLTLVFLAGVLVSRSPGALAGGLFALGVTVLISSAHVLGTGVLANAPLTALLVTMGILALTSSRYDRFLGLLLRQPRRLARRPIWVAAAAAAGLAGVVAITSPAWSYASSTNLLLAAGLLVGCGLQWEHRLVLTAGALMASVGLHGVVGVAFGMPSTAAALLTMGAFAVSAGAALLMGSRQSLWTPAARISSWGHAALAFGWLAVALAADHVTVQPMIIGLVGAAVVLQAIRDHQGGTVEAGLILLTLYPPLQAMWLDLLDSWPGLLTVALVCAFLWVVAARQWGQALVSAWGPRSVGCDPIFQHPAEELVVRPSEHLLQILARAGLVLGWILAGSSSLVLSLVLLGVIAAQERERLSPLAKLAVLAPAPCFLAMVQIATAWHGGEGWLALVMLEQMPGIVLPGAALLSMWLLAAEAMTGERKTTAEIELWRGAAEALLLLGYAAAWLSPLPLTGLEHLGLLAVALLGVARHVRSSQVTDSVGAGALVQLWASAAVVQVLEAGWVHIDGGLAPYALLGAGLVEQALAAWAGRHGRGRGLARPAGFTAQGLVAAAGLLGLVRAWSLPTGANAWAPIVPLFLASLVFLLLASEEEQLFPALASAGFLGAGLLALVSSQGLSGEFYCLGPGAGLIALSLLLRERMGPTWSGHLFAAGAACIYATPVLALYHELAWTWQASLAVLAAVFGAASFVLRSRSLLTVSTAALLVDLICFVIKVRETEPMLLWVGGVGFGVTLIAVATYLEHRREGLLQQIRVFGRELQCWH